MNEPCGCCEGSEPLTPISTANRPGLDALVYRVGTHTKFLETMKARLSSSDFPSLANLKTRDASDPAIAFLDAWATVADVLTFYQERIANEGYLRTATERRSILELARLVGYTLRPSVAATVYPAFTMETGYNKGSKIPAGTRIQSLPGPNEMPQFFETARTIEACADWNNLQSRLTRPHYITLEKAKTNDLETVYFQGISTNLKPNDPLLLVFGNSEGRQIFRQVQAIEPQAMENRTMAKLQKLKPEESSNLNQNQELNGKGKRKCPFEKLGSADEGLLKGLLQPPSIPPANALQLGLTPKEIYKCESDMASQLLATLKPVLKDTLYIAWANTEGITAPSELQSTEALRVKAAPFGANAPPKPVYDDRGRLQGSEEWAIAGTETIGVALLVNSDYNPEAVTISIERDMDTDSVEVPLEGEFPRTTHLDGREIQVDFTPAQTRINGGGSTPNAVIVNSSDWSVRLTGPQSRQWTVQLRSDTARVITPNQALQYSRANASKVTINFNSVEQRAEPILTILDKSPISTSSNQRTILVLDAQYDQITLGSWVVIERSNSEKPDGKERLIRQVMKTETISKADYGISARVTQLTLNDNWLKETDLTLDKLREITVYAQSEELKLAEEAIDPKKEPVKGNEIELGDLYDGLQPGRWLIVSGERVDLGEKTTGVKASELVMLSGVTQRVAKVKDSDQDLPGDKTHTFLQLAKPLEYQYKRDIVTVYGNVVKATHGETRNEVLGSGDSSKAFQQFPLHQPPLTYLAAPTPSGAASTLEVRVNDILWHETDSLAGLKPSDRLYITKTDDDGITTVIFGNGHNGLRLPTGVENIKAIYCNGIGKVGNVNAEQISLLATRPLGLKGVINPLPATGGADKESRDQARRNAPLAVMALDRLVSVQDYADFTCTFAGIGKASATDLSDGRRQLVYVTIAGADNIPIDKSSDLYRNLLQALQELGDPHQPIQVQMRELMLLLIVASIRILSDYQWESVEPRIRQRLLDTFSFERRELGQAVFLSEVISTIQQVPGVAYVDVDILDTVSETEAADPTKLVAKIQALTQNEVSPSGIQSSATGTDKPQDEKQPKNRIPISLARVEPDVKKRFLPKQLIQPAQLAVLSPTVPLTLILNPMEVKP